MLETRTAAAEIHGELQGRVQHLGSEHHDDGQDDDGELDGLQAEQRGGGEDEDRHEDVDAHVALGAHHGDEAVVGVGEATADALLALLRFARPIRHRGAP
jgi:hypothetical protein